MGRHSAPDDDSDADRAGSSVAVASPAAPEGGVRPRPGRHARPDDEDPAPPPTSPPGPRPDPGLGLIEDALYPDAETDTAPTAQPQLPAVDDATEVIPAVADPQLDRPLPEADTDRMRAVEDADAAPAERPRPKPGPRKAVSDLILVRQHADVRARCLAAVLVPIGVYLGVLAVIGRLEMPTVLIWCFAPLVTAGVLVGLFLDAGHRKYAPTE